MQTLVHRCKETVTRQQVMSDRFPSTWDRRPPLPRWEIHPERSLLAGQETLHGPDRWLQSLKEAQGWLPHMYLFLSVYLLELLFLAVLGLSCRDLFVAYDMLILSHQDGCRI